MMNKMTIDEIAQAIKNKDCSHSPILIAIEGFGGSGKTTLANKLRNTLQSAHVVNMDDFIVKEELTKPSWDKGGFDRQRLEKQVLLPASKQQPVQYQELIWETNTLSRLKVVPNTAYLIVEGISAYHPTLADYYDFKIWVDTPIEVAKARGKVRDAGNENVDKWDMWAQNDLAYRDEYRPEERADFVTSNY